MDNERDRGNWPDDDRPAEPSPPEADWTTSDDAPESGASDPGWGTAGDAGIPTAGGASADREPAPAEIESWPSQERRWVDDETGAWPTETSPPAPPSVGSTWDGQPATGGEPGVWQTSPDAAEVAAMAAAEANYEPTANRDAMDEGADAPMGGEYGGLGAPADRDEPAPGEVEAYPATPPVEAGAATMAGAVATPAHAVPDAEAATGESTQCPRCGTENRPGLSFCRNCGQRLVAAGVASTVERPGTPEGTMACPRCGTHNRAGVAFCQNCGANLRGTSEGYVPPALAADEEAATEPAARGAVLGPVVLLIGLAGVVTAYLLPFLYGSSSLFDRAWGTDGYGIAFWNGYPEVAATLADQAYFGLAGPAPVFGALLLVLAVAGFMRAAPGTLQSIGLGIALLWSVALIVLFFVVEVFANWGGDIVGLLRVLTPAGIIFFLSSLIVVIGTLTRFSRG